MSPPAGEVTWDKPSLGIGVDAIWLFGKHLSGSLLCMSERQDRLLEMHDGRFFAIDRLNTGLAILVKTEMVKTEKVRKNRTVTFGLPSGPALFLNLARRAFTEISAIEPVAMFVAWQNGRVPTNHSALFNYFEQFISHVVFSFTALEAFSNQAIPREYLYRTSRNGQMVELRKADIERSVTLDEKLDVVLPNALGLRSPKGRKLWEGYRQTKRMRDRIIHLKTVDYTPSGPEAESVWGMMLRSRREPFCDYAHALMGHYESATNRRWFREYPFEKFEPDGLMTDSSSEGD